MNLKFKYSLMVATVLMMAVVGCFVFAADSGVSVGITTIPLNRDKATAPYGVFQEWKTKKCFDDVDNTVKLSATYANCAIRFVQDPVTKNWFMTIPAELPNGIYIVEIRDGADNSELNTDTHVATVIIDWSTTNGITTTYDNMIVSY